MPVSLDFVQYSAPAALREAGDEVKHMAKVYNKRRKYLAPRLKDLGFGVPNTNSLDDIKEAMERAEKFLKKL